MNVPRAQYPLLIPKQVSAQSFSFSSWRLQGGSKRKSFLKAAFVANSLFCNVKDEPLSQSFETFEFSNILGVSSIRIKYPYSLKGIFCLWGAASKQPYALLFSLSVEKSQAQQWIACIAGGGGINDIIFAGILKSSELRVMGLFRQKE